MSKGKKILPLFTAAAMLFTTLAFGPVTQVSAAADDFAVTASVSPSTVNTQQPTTVTLTVGMNGVPTEGISSFEFVVKFPNDLLEYKTTSYSGDVAKWISDGMVGVRDDSQGFVRVTGFCGIDNSGNLAPATSSGKMAELQFTTKPPLTVDKFSFEFTGMAFNTGDPQIALPTDISQWDSQWKNKPIDVSVSGSVTPDKYQITVTAGTGGTATITGNGTYSVGDWVTVTATPYTGYTFSGWYENNVRVPDAEATYMFAATTNRTLQARFTANGGGGSTWYGGGGNVYGPSGGSGGIVASSTTGATGSTSSPAASDNVSSQLNSGKTEVTISAGASGTASVTIGDAAALIGKNAAASVSAGSNAVKVNPAVIKDASANGTKSFAITAQAQTPPAALTTALAAKNPANTQIAAASAVRVGVSNVNSFASPVTVEFDTKSLNLTEAQKANLVAVAYNDDGTYTLVGGVMDKATGKLTYKADKPGTYAVALLTGTHVTMSTTSKSFSVNNAAKTMDVTPEIKNNFTMVPVRFIVEALGGDVAWNAATKTVTITLDGKSVDVTIGQTVAGATPYIADGRTMVPLRYISETLGCTVLYDAATKAIDIYK